MKTPHPTAGFALPDLLAIVGMIALSACLLVSVHADGRPDSQVYQCLNNLRQLGAGWSMYAEDHDGRLVPNRSGHLAGRTLEMSSWVAGTLDFTASPANTNTIYLVGSDPPAVNFGGLLGPYVRSPSLFRCPDDPVRTAGVLSYPRVRSYSMNNWIGEGATSLSSGTRMQFYTHREMLAKPGPDRLFVFIEEHPNSINDGTFFTDPDRPPGGEVIIDWPAASHGGGCVFGFADARAELHRWIDPRTKPSFILGQPTFGNVTTLNNPDIAWLNSVATTPR